MLFLKTIFEVKMKTICLKMCVSYRWLTSFKILRFLSDDEAFQYNLMSYEKKSDFINKKMLEACNVETIIGTEGSQKLAEKLIKWIYYYGENDYVRTYETNTMNNKKLLLIFSDLILDKDSFNVFKVNENELEIIGRIKFMYDDEERINNLKLSKCLL